METYTYDNFKAYKDKHGLSNKDISEAIGTTENNVKVQLRPSKKLPSWARAMLYADSLANPAILDISNNLPENIQEIESEQSNPSNKETPIIINYPCGCTRNDKGLFNRKKGCNIKPQEH